MRNLSILRKTTVVVALLIFFAGQDDKCSRVSESLFANGRRAAGGGKALGNWVSGMIWTTKRKFRLANNY
jgi:hypothetical protein